jgi:hypothetical protein
MTQHGVMTNVSGLVPRLHFGLVWPPKKQQSPWFVTRGFAIYLHSPGVGAGLQWSVQPSPERGCWRCYLP